MTQWLIGIFVRFQAPKMTNEGNKVSFIRNLQQSPQTVEAIGWED